jgi:hypothetical protein
VLKSSLNGGPFPTVCLPALLFTTCDYQLITLTTITDSFLQTPGQNSLSCNLVPLITSQHEQSRKHNCYTPVVQLLHY